MHLQLLSIQFETYLEHIPEESDKAHETLASLKDISTLSSANREASVLWINTLANVQPQWVNFSTVRDMCGQNIRLLYETCTHMRQEMYDDCVAKISFSIEMETINVLGDICRLCKGFPEVVSHPEVDELLNAAKSRCLSSAQNSQKRVLDSSHANASPRKKLPSPRSGIGKFLGWEKPRAKGLDGPDIGYLDVGDSYAHVTFSRSHFGDMHLQKKWLISYSITDGSNNASSVDLTPIHQYSRS